MNAPQQCPANQFNRLVDDWLVAHATKITRVADAGDYVCRTCGTRIEWVRTYMSIHVAGFTCAGFGEVENPTIPCCRQCEPNPVVTGCLHIPLHSDEIQAPSPRKSVVTRATEWLRRTLLP